MDSGLEFFAKPGETASTHVNKVNVATPNALMIRAFWILAFSSILGDPEFSGSSGPKPHFDTRGEARSP